MPDGDGSYVELSISSRKAKNKWVGRYSYVPYPEEKNEERKDQIRRMLARWLMQPYADEWRDAMTKMVDRASPAGGQPRERRTPPSPGSS